MIIERYETELSRGTKVVEFVAIAQIGQGTQFGKGKTDVEAKLNLLDQIVLAQEGNDK